MISAGDHLFLASSRDTEKLAWSVCWHVCWWWSSVLSSTACSDKHRHLIACSKTMPLAAMLSFLVTLCAIGSCRSVPISAVLLLETIERPWVVSYKYVYMHLTIKRWNCEFWLGQLQSQCQVQWTQRCSGYNSSNLALYFKNRKENLKIS